MGLTGSPGNQGNDTRLMPLIALTLAAGADIDRSRGGIMSEKEQVALGSIGASAALTIGKAVVGWSTGSLAILSEAAHSLIDFAATLMTYFAVRIANKPADKEHHYGHGKVESVSALAETALLFVLSGVVLWEAVQRLSGDHGHVVEATATAFGIIIVSIAIDFFRARVLSRTAAATSSQALEADALHFSSDMWSSAAVLVGLVGVRVGYHWADSAAAIVVALFVCLAGWRLGRRTIDTLTDTAPEGVAERIVAIARKVRNVVSVERVRAREVGATIFGEIEVGASRTLPLDRVETMKSDIEAAIKAVLPHAEIGVSVIPRALDDETVMERVMVIARNRALAVHHVTVHAIADKLSISLDLEVDGELSLAAAHDIADGLEGAIRDEFGPAVEVETHIEPLQMKDLAGRDAPTAHVVAVKTTLAELAASGGVLRNVHDVRVRDTTNGEIVNFHCDVDPASTVAAVHEKVDGVEHDLRQRFPTIKRVIGHAEPRR
jgi:cation diffusion facilitator family transporter